MCLRCNIQNISFLDRQAEVLSKGYDMSNDDLLRLRRQTSGKDSFLMNYTFSDGTKDTLK